MARKKLYSILAPESMSLIDFVKEGWSASGEPGDFIHNWHMDVICEHLEAVHRREIKKLLITIPPRHSKTLLISVFFPAWVWTQSPKEQLLCSSYAYNLTVDIAKKARHLVTSDWYLEKFGNICKVPKFQGLQAFYNDKGGYRKSAPAGGNITGLGGSMIVVDDPHKMDEAHSKAKRQKVIAWWRDTMSTRINPPRDRGVQIIIMQRCHQEDLAGFILAHSNFEHLCIPARYDPSVRINTSLNWKDPRKSEGDFLWPEAFGPEQYETERAVQGVYMFSAQYQQQPISPRGAIIKRDWWKFYDKSEIHPVTNNFCIHYDGNVIYPDEIVQSWDLTFKDRDTNDFVVGQVWARKGANKFLLAQLRSRMSFPATKKAIRDMVESWPETNSILIEEKASGPIVISELQDEIAGIIPFNPTIYGGKSERLYGISAQIEAGNVILPRDASWVEDYIEEFASATPDGGGKYWDQIDATTQALIRLGKSKPKLTWGRGEKKEKVSRVGTGRKLTFGRRIIVIGERRKKAYNL